MKALLYYVYVGLPVDLVEDPAVAKFPVEDGNGQLVPGYGGLGIVADIPGQVGPFFSLLHLGDQSLSQIRTSQQLFEGKSLVVVSVDELEHIQIFDVAD